MSAGAGITAKPNAGEKLGFWLLVTLVFVSRAFFLDMGFGRPDAWRVGVTGKFWVLTGEYTPSRPPGFPLLEMISASSYAVFGQSPLTWLATNALSCLIFCVSVAAVWILARKWGVRSPLLAAGIYAFCPLNWVYSVETIDYVWTASFTLLSVLMLESERKQASFWSGVLLGLAASARFFAAVQLIPLLILAWTKRRSIWDPLMLFCAFALVSFGFYFVILSRVADWSEYIDWFHELNRVSSRMAEIRGGILARRFLIPASGLFGPLATVALIVVGLAGLRSAARRLRAGDRGMWTAATLTFFAMAPYLWHLHPNYWIPATGFLLILLARTTDVRLFAVAGALVVAANFPWWQANVEGLRLMSPQGRSRGIENFARGLAPYQNETVFQETQVRSLVFGSTEELLRTDLPSDWVIMAGLRLPMIQFLVDDMRRVETPLADGTAIDVWKSPSRGPGYRYMISPTQARKLIESGYQVRYIPGLENTYSATYGTHPADVAGVEPLY